MSPCAWPTGSVCTWLILKLVRPSMAPGIQLAVARGSPGHLPFLPAPPGRGSQGPEQAAATSFPSHPARRSVPFAMGWVALHYTQVLLTAALKIKAAHRTPALEDSFLPLASVPGVSLDALVPG